MEQSFFRQICGNFATGVTVISSQKEDGTQTGFTANSFTSVSLDPALVLFCLNKEAQSASFFSIGAAVGISILTDQQTELSNRFANPKITAVERFKQVALLSQASAPILANCMAWMEGVVESKIDGGDHWIFISRITQGAIEKPDSSPLLYALGNYNTLKN
jgi:flavin reductase (DIM6/NTAB) family NADH-FMN oxidoreductase RutF